MVEVGVSPSSKKLFISYVQNGKRFIEETAMVDTAINRLSVDGLAFRLQRSLADASFCHETFFSSDASKQFTALEDHSDRHSNREDEQSSVLTAPTLEEFASEWFAENKLIWRPSYVATMQLTLEGRIIPALGRKRVDQMTRADLLAFRSNLIRTDPATGKTIAASRINHIMTPLRMMLEEASVRYEFQTPFRGIKPLRLPRTEVHPLSLTEIKELLAAATEQWRHYLAIKIFTGLRSGEINGLEWKHIDLSHDVIKVRQAIVGNQVQDTKTAASTRDIPMPGFVRSAFLAQRKASVSDRWVFANRDGNPIDLVNFTNRVWHPLLDRAGLEPRRPYQTRHTAATLMLASGENPEWVARVLGHSTTEMLFTVYSRYIPNLTRMDGNAFSSLLARNFINEGGETQVDDSHGVASMSRSELEQLVRDLQVRNRPLTCESMRMEHAT